MMHEIPQRLHCLSKGQCESTKSFGGAVMNGPIASHRAAQDKQTSTTTARPLLLRCQVHCTFLYPSGECHVPVAETRVQALITTETQG